MNIINGIKICFTAIGTFLGYLVGGFDTMMITLLLFMAFDYITGILSAIKKKKLSSRVGFWGIVKKAFIIIIPSMIISLSL